MSPKMSVFCLLCIFFIFLSPCSMYAQNSENELVVADFDSGSKPNNIGGIFGTWDYDPNDDTQGCSMRFSNSYLFEPETGYAMRLDYDVQSPNPAFNGFWMKLEGIDVTEYNRFRFWVKGDAQRNFTTRFKVELKNSLGKRAVYLIKNVTPEWREVMIDFKKTRAIKDWSNLSEFTVVFSDLVSTYKEGTIYIDRLSFLKVSENSPQA